MATSAPVTPMHHLSNPMETTMPSDLVTTPDEECLKERKWWCFLLSSIFTFLMGVLSVLFVRGIISLFCKRDSVRKTPFGYHKYSETKFTVLG